MVIREFDLISRRFVEGGFFLPEAKGGAAWLNDSTLLVSTVLGGELFQTISGYACTVRRWQRGTPFADAPAVFECDRADMSVNGWRDNSPRYSRTWFHRQIDFFSKALFVEDGEIGRAHV